MKRLIATRRRKVAAVTAVLALVCVSVAAAAWLVTSLNGNGRTKVASLSVPSIAMPPSFSGAGNLFPGGNGDVQVNITNPNNVPLNIVGILGSTATFTPTNPATCPPSNFTLNASGVSATPSTVPANASGFAVTLNNLVHLAASADTLCQGQDVQITGGIRIDWST
jgi:hypothetical protein